MGVLVWDVITSARRRLAFRIGRKLHMSGRILQCPWTCWARIWRLLQNEGSIRDPDGNDGSWSARTGVAMGGQWLEWLSKGCRPRY